MTAPVKDTKDVAPEDEPVSGGFNPNDYDWPNHLKKALDDLKVKRVRIDKDWLYYDGEHPKVWLTDSIRDKLDDELVTNMAENWCDTAVDAPIKRLRVEGFTVKLEGQAKKEESDDPTQSNQAQNVWEDNDLELAQKDIYTASRCTGESFVFAWKDDEKEFGIDAVVNDARNVWWPDDAHRSKPTRVIKVWADEDDGVWRATCYYKYVVVRLVGPRLKDQGSTDDYMPQARYFEPDPADPGGEHGFEDVPVFRFARAKKRRSLISQISTIQDKINKLAANLLVTAEFNAWRKMIVMTQQAVEDDDLKMRPNRILVLDPGGGEDGAAPTSIWEGSATDLSIYSNEQDKLIDKLFTKACLPGHLKIKAEREVPSGAAYEADEGPFTEDILDMSKSYGATWVDFFQVVLGIEVTPQWANPHIKSDKDEADTVKVYTDAGVPLELALKKYAGWTDKELEELADAPLSPAEQMQMAATQALVNGGVPDDGTTQPGQPPKPNGAGQPPTGAKPGAKPPPFGR